VKAEAVEIGGAGPDQLKAVVRTVVLELRPLAAALFDGNCSTALHAR
jgi:hypothetical protein